MRVVFFGTPEYVLPILTSLDKNFKERGGGSPIVAVVTQKPRPAGRSKKLKLTPVDTWAHKKKIPVYHNSGDLLKSQVQADLGILAAYGAIIPKQVIGLFSHGILNVHPSLLPSFRGASPVQAAILTGEEEAGVTIIKIDTELDHGPTVSQFKELINPSDTAGQLRARLFEKSAIVMTALIPPYVDGKITPRLQEHEKATFTTLLKKDHGLIPGKYLKSAIEGKSSKEKWEIGFMKMKSSQASLIKDFSIQPTPQVIERFIRAMQPWPACWTHVQLNSKSLPAEASHQALQAGEARNSKRLKILKAHLEERSNVKGQMSKVKLVLDEVQLEGKNPVSWKQFKEAYPKAMFE